MLNNKNIQISQEKFHHARETLLLNSYLNRYPYLTYLSSRENLITSNKRAEITMIYRGVITFTIRAIGRRIIHGYTHT